MGRGRWPRKASQSRPFFGLPDLRSSRNPDAGRRIGVFVYQGVTTAEIDQPVTELAKGLGPVDVVHIGCDLDPVVGVEPVRTVHVDLVVSDPLALKLDVLVLPGGLGWEAIVGDVGVMTWLAHVTSRIDGILAISTGSLLLASVGRLEGLEATGHWLARDRLSDLGAEVSTDRTVQSDDDRVVTASGANSAVQAAAELADRVRWGPA